MVVNTEKLKANPALGKALVGAWYEIMALMSKDDAEGQRGALGDGQGVGHRPRRLRQPAQADHQMFYAPADAVAFAEGQTLPETMEQVAQFSFDHGLMGEGAKSAEASASPFPRASRWATQPTQKLRFRAST